MNLLTLSLTLLFSEEYYIMIQKKYAPVKLFLNINKLIKNIY